MLGSVGSHFAKLDPGPIAPVTALLTLVAGVIAVFEPAYLADRRAALVSFALVAVWGGLVEFVGVTTGFPFGRYRYTETWWPTISIGNGGRFPLALPLAWGLIVGASYFAIPGERPRWMRALFAALLAMLVDLVMEPSLSGPMHYWEWSEHGPLPGGVPWANALGWFGTALVAAWFFRGTNQNSQARIVLVAHVALVLVIGLVAGHSFR